MTQSEIGVLKTLGDECNRIDLSLNQLFFEMDVNKDGNIDSKEFLENIRDRGIDVNNHEIEKIFKKLDWNNSGQIDHFEF